MLFRKPNVVYSLYLFAKDSLETYYYSLSQDDKSKIHRKEGENGCTTDRTTGVYYLVNVLSLSLPFPSVIENYLVNSRRGINQVKTSWNLSFYCIIYEKNCIDEFMVSGTKQFTICCGLILFSFAPSYISWIFLLKSIYSTLKKII